MLAFDTTAITSIISNLVAISRESQDVSTGNLVTITCSKTELVFIKDGGHMIQHARFRLSTGLTENGKDDEEEPVKKKKRRSRNSNNETFETDCERKVIQSTVSNKYSLKYLHQLQKCFSINRGFICMFIKKDHPLIFEVSIGTLGKLRAVLMFADNDEDEDEDDEEEEE
jgi:hypothetical protein